MFNILYYSIKAADSRTEVTAKRSITYTGSALSMIEENHYQVPRSVQQRFGSLQRGSSFSTAAATSTGGIHQELAARLSGGATTSPSTHAGAERSPPVPAKPRPRKQPSKDTPPVPTKPFNSQLHTMSLPRHMSTGKKQKPPCPLPEVQSEENIENLCGEIASSEMSPVATSDSQVKPQRITYHDFDDEPLVGLSLQQFVKEYGDKVPVRICILRGFCGSTPRTTISRNDIYDVHFVKHTKVVTISDSAHNTYCIPLNSSIEFSILFNPENNLQKAIQGYTYEKIGNILSLSRRPKIISSLTYVDAGGSKQVVNEILIVKGVQRSKMRARKGLIVFNVHTKTETTLSDNVYGSFSTRPCLVKLHLPDIVDHMVKPFPAEALMTVDHALYSKQGSRVHKLPDALFSKVIHVNDSYIETTLVSSMDERDERLEKVLFDIPVTDKELFDIEVTIVDVKTKTEVERLYRETETAMQSFDPTKVVSCKDAGSEVSYAAQSLLYHTVRPGCEEIGIEIDEPTSSIYDVPRDCMERLKRHGTPKVTKIPPKIPTRSEHTTLQTVQKEVGTDHNPATSDKAKAPLPILPEPENDYDTVTYEPPNTASEETLHTQQTREQLPVPIEPDSDYDTILNCMTYWPTMQQQQPLVPPRDSKANAPPSTTGESQSPHGTDDAAPVPPPITSLVQPPRGLAGSVSQIAELKKTTEELTKQSKTMMDKLRQVDRLVLRQESMAVQVNTLESQVKELLSRGKQDPTLRVQEPSAAAESSIANTEEANRIALCSLDALQVRSACYCNR